MEGKRLEKNCDVVVVGAGHAGCEAALAAATEAGDAKLARAGYLRGMDLPAIVSAPPESWGS